MERVVQIYESTEAAERADAAFYASLTPQERVDLVLDLVARHREALGEAGQGFKRVYRVVDLGGS